MSALPTTLIAALVVALAPSSARAQQQVGTAFSGTTVADGASAWINPAAMSASEGSRLELVLGFVTASLDYAPDDGEHGATEGSSFGPLFTAGGFTDAIHDDLRLGLTAALSHAEGATWGRDGGAASITRYYMADAAFFHVSVAPALSWSPREWISIGAGPNVVYGALSTHLDDDVGASLNRSAGSTELDSPFPYAHPDLAAPVSVAADGIGVGAIGGVLVRPIDELTIGLSVHSPVSIDGSGTLSVDYPQRLVDFVEGTLPSAELPALEGAFDVALDRPWIVLAGVSAYPRPDLELAADYTFEAMSAQQNFNLVITEATSESIESTTKPQAYGDRHRIAARVAWLPVPELRLALVGAFQTNTVPELTAAPNNLDFDRVELGLAARWHVSDVSITLHYSHVFLTERAVRQSLHRPVTDPALDAFDHPSPTGTYGGAADTLRASFAVDL